MLHHILMKIGSAAQLGPYEILAPIGAGGMGEVYRARDTRLGRTVAIKMLPAEFAGDARLRARLEREARTISALNHPHICTLYDVGENYLVMEYCEGKTLAQRILAGPLPIEQVLQHGVEMAGALDKAHRSGIVHRDMKPSNIMITKSGVKLLDFGLARNRAPIMEDKAAATASFEDSITGQGKLAGTVQYMAPEVLSGNEADARSDIFALGLVLYEMTTGEPAFVGENTASLIAAILREEPRPLRQIQPLAPPALDHVIRKCLSKDPDDRWQSAHDVAEELRWITESGSQAGLTASPLRRKRRAWLWAGAAAAAVVSAIASLGWWQASRPERPIARAVIPLPAGTFLCGPSQSSLAVSPDGRKIVYSAVGVGKHLYLRNIDQFDDAPISGTEAGEGPFFSPDGKWIGFFEHGRLKKVPVTGGTAQTLASVGGPGRGGTWSADGTIYFCPGPSLGLWKTSVNDPRPEPLTIPDISRGENGHRWPQILPDGKHILFTIRTDRIASFDEAKIAVLSLATGKWHVVLEGGSHARYLPTGHLVFGRSGVLYGIPFDLDSLIVRGSPVPILHGISTSDSSGATQYAVAERAGTLLYAPAARSAPNTILVAVDRTGKQTSALTIHQRVVDFRVSPDQKLLALQVAAANDDIWTYELERGTLTRVSFLPGDEWSPGWTSKGNKILFGSRQALWWQSADGSGSAEELARAPDVGVGSGGSPDERLIVYSTRNPSTGVDLWMLPLDGDRKPRVVLRTPYQEGWAVFSPDGRWIVYSSNASGTSEVYVRSVAGGGQWQISNGGGSSARWSRDGRELFYWNGDDFYKVSISLRDIPTAGRPRLLFTRPQIAAYDVFGSGFLLMPIRRETLDVSSIHLVLDWFRDLRTRAGE
jgi:Tol biopolymer transport system component/tRNA A-37 threonylcarbamoyl transferase component Bud32